MITFAMVIATALVTWYLPKFMEKKKIEITLQELSLSGGRYAYLIDVSNEGRVPVQEVNLLALVNGNVYSSMFNDSPTTRDPYFRLTKSPFNGKVLIKEEESVKTIDYPYSQEVHTNQRETVELLKQVARDLISSKSSVWYKINITPFYLAVNDTVNASIITDKPIDKDRIKCEPTPEICKISKVETISREKFERIFGALSVQQGSVSNKIFGSGIGMSNHMIKGAAMVDAKQKAIKDFYKDIVQKLYGVEVKSLIKNYSETTGSGDDEKIDIVYSNVISLSSTGVIDRSAAVIYHENSEKMESGEIVYEVRGYYELPEEIELSDQYAKLDSGFMLPSAPIELEGVRPGWVDHEPIDYGDVILSSVGVSDPSMPYAVAKLQAENRALANMSLALRSKVSELVEEYVESSGDTKKQQFGNVVTSATTKITDNNLKGSRVVAYYKDENGLAYALAAIPNNVVKWTVSNEAQNLIPAKNMTTSINNDRALWQQFMSRKSLEELDAELEKVK